MPHRRSQPFLKKFNRQDPSVRRHGPKKKREVFMDAITEVLESGFMDEWRTGEEIAYQANKKTSDFWSALSVFVLTSYMRKFVSEGTVERYKPQSGKPYVYKRFFPEKIGKN